MELVLVTTDSGAIPELVEHNHRATRAYATPPGRRSSAASTSDGTRRPSHRPPGGSCRAPENTNGRATSTVARPHTRPQAMDGRGGSPFTITDLDTG